MAESIARTVARRRAVVHELELGIARASPYDAQCRGGSAEFGRAVRCAGDCRRQRHVPAVVRAGGGRNSPRRGDREHLVAEHRLVHAAVDSSADLRVRRRERTGHLSRSDVEETGDCTAAHVTGRSRLGAGVLRAAGSDAIQRRTISHGDRSASSASRRSGTRRRAGAAHDSGLVAGASVLLCAIVSELSGSTGLRQQCVDTGPGVEAVRSASPELTRHSAHQWRWLDRRRTHSRALGQRVHRTQVDDRRRGVDRSSVGKHAVALRLCRGRALGSIAGKRRRQRSTIGFGDVARRRRDGRVPRFCAELGRTHTKRTDHRRFVGRSFAREAKRTTEGAIDRTGSGEEEARSCHPDIICDSSAGQWSRGGIRQRERRRGAPNPTRARHRSSRS